MKRVCWALALSLLPAAMAAGNPTASKIVVAADGSGDFKTVQAALDSIPKATRTRVTIEIHPGTYKERLTAAKGGAPITFLGTGAEKTVLTFDNKHTTLGPDGKELGTSKSASVFVNGSDFVAENVTFENSAGKTAGQAVALNVSGDRAVFRKCRFLGWQDTLLTNIGRQYFEDCYIAGHVDYIFGKSSVWFEKCEMCCLAGGAVTAAATPQESAYGYVFSHCKITKGPDVPAAVTILGRPWRSYGSAIYLECEMADVIAPKGWDPWNMAERPNNEKTARFAEYHSTGPGAAPDKRLPWSKQLTDDEARVITIDAVVGGKDHWNPTAPPAAATTMPAPTSAPAATTPAK